MAIVFLLLFVGHETATHLISGSAHELLKNPDLRDWLEEDWSRADLAVDESEIRWRKRPGIRAIDHLPVAPGLG